MHISIDLYKDYDYEIPQCKIEWHECQLANDILFALKILNDQCLKFFENSGKQSQEKTNDLSLEIFRKYNHQNDELQRDDDQSGWW